MSDDFVITDAMKQAEATAWKKRLEKFRSAQPVDHEIRTGTEPKFVNKDSAAKLHAFRYSFAADDALDAAIEAIDKK